MRWRHPVRRTPSPSSSTNGDGQKHLLAEDDTPLLALGDVIALGAPIRQAISIGDILVHLGIGWFIVIGDATT